MLPDEITGCLVKVDWSTLAALLLKFCWSTAVTYVWIEGRRREKEIWEISSFSLFRWEGQKKNYVKTFNWIVSLQDWKEEKFGCFQFDLITMFQFVSFALCFLPVLWNDWIWNDGTCSTFPSFHWFFEPNWRNSFIPPSLSLIFLSQSLFFAFFSIIFRPFFGLRHAKEVALSSIWSLNLIG